MVTEVMLPQVITDPVFHRKMMDGIVRHVVAQIPGDETGKKRKYKYWAAHGFEYEEEKD